MPTIAIDRAAASKSSSRINGFLAPNGGSALVKAERFGHSRARQSGRSPHPGREGRDFREGCMSTVLAPPRPAASLTRPWRLGSASRVGLLTRPTARPQSRAA